MTVFVDDPDFTLYVGDALDVLAGLPDESVHCVVTSPPYWGLRDYGTGSWDGGNEHCDHAQVVAPRRDAAVGQFLPSRGEQEARAGLNTVPFRDVCGKCGARRTDHQLGLEPTPDQYVANMVGVFREVRRVLRRDGTCWLNIGDSYASGPRGNAPDDWSSSGLTGVQTSARYRDTLANGTAQTRDKTKIAGLKPKDLCMIPARLAMALQEPYYTGEIRSETDRAWLAAVVDSEGCIYISRSKAGATTGRDRKYVRTQDAFDVGVKITNTNRALLERVAEIVGYGNIREQKNNGQQAYDWTAYSSKARRLLAELYPHLVAKQHEARIAHGCPPSGESARKAHVSLKAIHQGLTPCIDFAPPEGMFERGWFLRSEIIWAKLCRTPCLNP